MNHSFDKIESVPVHYLSDFLLDYNLYDMVHILWNIWDGSYDMSFVTVVSLEYRLHFFLVQATIVRTFDKCNIHLVSASSWISTIRQKLQLTIGSYSLSNNADLYIQSKNTEWLSLFSCQLFYKSLTCIRSRA